MAKSNAARVNRAKFQGAIDRYTDVQRASLHPTGVGQPVPSQQVRTKLVGIADPLDDKALAPLLATVNYRVDILEQERANKRISPAAYLTGRIVQATFEKQGRVGSSNWRGGDRVDAAVAHEKQIWRMLENARLIDALMQRMFKKIGEHGTYFLRAILTGEKTFQSYAGYQQQLQARRLGLRRSPSNTGKPSDRAITQIATQFRELLEVVAEELAAVGKGRAPIRGGQAEPIAGEDFDAKGRLVEEGEGYRWGDRSDAAAEDQELVQA